MIKFKDYLLESKAFSNWVNPTDSDISREHEVEFVKKGMGNKIPAFKDKKAFMDAVKKAKPVKITKDMDRKIDYRSRTRNQDDLLDLIKSYRSYPKHRNEETLQAIYDGFAKNSKMTRPMVLQFSDGSRRVFAGNTRMDVAFHMGVDPEVLVIEVPD